MAVLQAVLFDLGDTLVDLGEGRGSYEDRLLLRTGHVYDVLAATGARLPEREAFCRALATDSEAQYHAALAEQRGINIYTVMRRFFAHTGIPADDGLVEKGSEAYCQSGVDAPPLRLGALEMLTALRGWGLKLGAISNTLQPARYMHQAHVRRGLAEFFDVEAYSSEAGVAKPHPTIFRAALDEIDVAPARAVYVGDRLHADVAGAQAVGMRGILIEVAHRAEDDPAIAPDARIKELSELLQILPGWIG
jgi:putative hydrolase of the HAD superfamily